MAPNALAPWSSSSYGLGGIYIGIIESIDDPLRRNRVQVRLFGYQTDQATIPKDKLEWVHVLQHNSQMAGATSTHMYLPGARVAVQQIGTELTVIGAMPGFDSDKRNAGENKANDSKQPDTPAVGQGEKKPQAQAADGTARDVIQLKRQPSANSYLKEPEEKKGFDYAKGTAPFEKGNVSKFPEMMSLGIQQLMKGSDVLSTIRQMDGNASGAIKSALNILMNLRQNGFGTSKDIVGVGLILDAAKQFASNFGAAPALNLSSIVRELIDCAGIMKGITPQNITSLLNDGSLTRVVTSLSSQTLSVSPDVISQMQDAIDNISLATPGFDHQPFIDQLQSGFLTGLQTSVGSITDQLNSFTDLLGGPGGLVQAFGDAKSFTDLASNFSALSSSIGIPTNAINSIAGGAFGAAMSGNLGSLTSMLSPDAIKNVTSMLNMFSGNPVALSELTSGQVNPQSLLKIPLKYAQKKTNQPSKSFISDKIKSLDVMSA